METRLSMRAYALLRWLGAQRSPVHANAIGADFSEDDVAAGNVAEALEELERHGLVQPMYGLTEKGSRTTGPQL